MTKRATAGGPKAGPRRSFAAEVAELVKSIGGKKYADLSAEERHYFHSLRIRKRVALWLHWNEGETFESMKEIAVASAITAYCSQVTSARWIEIYTYKGMPWAIVPLPDGDYRLVERGEEKP